MNRPPAREEATRFIKSFCRRAGIEESPTALESFAAGADLRRVAHQPNFLPSFSILSMLLALGYMQTDSRTPKVPTYFIVDFDDACDKRFRASYLPASTPTGWRRLEMPIRPKSLMFEVPVPTADQ